MNICEAPGFASSRNRPPLLARRALTMFSPTASRGSQKPSSYRLEGLRPRAPPQTPPLERGSWRDSGTVCSPFQPNAARMHPQKCPNISHPRACFGARFLPDASPGGTRRFVQLGNGLSRDAGRLHWLQEGLADASHERHLLWTSGTCHLHRRRPTLVVGLLS